MFAKIKTWWLGVRAWFGSEKAKAKVAEEKVAAEFKSIAERKKPQPPAN